MPTAKFCSHCGQPIARAFLEGRERDHCPACGTIHYQNPLPAVCGLLGDGHGRLLLARRGVEPARGMWSLPGGFLELDESPEAAIVREFREETSLTVRVEALLGVVHEYRAEWGGLVLIGYRLVADAHGPLVADDDVEALEWFAHDAIPRLCFRSHRELLRRYLGAPTPTS